MSEHNCDGWDSCPNPSHKKPTLTEFILKRTAEDSADAMAGWRWKSLPVGEYERLQARVLAECEAKRRIVEEAPLWGCGRTMGKILAAVYADHPDYREEWSP